MEKYSYEFKSGVKIENVTFDQLVNLAANLGESIDASKLLGGVPKGYYLSESKGLVKIEGMDTQFVVNSMCKLARTYIETIRPTHVTDLKKFLEDFVNLGNDPKINELFTDLTTRLTSAKTTSTIPHKIPK